MAKKSIRGKAIRDKSGLSARQRAFSYFYQGLRPSQLPDLGVPMATIYRYYQAWKHRHEDIEFRVLKKLFKEDAGLRSKLTKKLGISEQELADAPLDLEGNFTPKDNYLPLYFAAGISAIKRFS